MIAASSRTSATAFALALAGLAASAFAGYVIATRPLSSTLLLVGAVLFLFVSFLHTRLAVYLIIFSMLLSPELGVGGVGSRQVTLRLEDLLLILVGVAWLARVAYFKELGLLRKSPLNRPIAAYAAAAIVATLVGGLVWELQWRRALLFLAKYLEYFVLYFLVLNNVRDRSDIRRYLAAALGTCAIVSLVGIAQIPSGERVSAPFEGEVGEPNTFGGYLVLMLSVASAFYLTASSFRERMAWLGFSAVIVLPLLYTLSRGSWIASGAMVLTLLRYGPRKGHLLAGGVLAVALSPLVVPRQVVERVEYTLKQPQEEGQIQVGRARLDTSFSERIRSWSYGIKGWARRPLTGYGVTGYGFMDAQYVRILTETGILGLAAFAWLAWRILTLGRERLRAAPDRFSQALNLGYLSGFVAMLVHGLGANTFIIIRIMEPFWLLTALVVALPETAEHSQEVQTPPRTGEIGARPAASPRPNRFAATPSTRE